MINSCVSSANVVFTDIMPDAIDGDVFALTDWAITSGAISSGTLDAAQAAGAFARCQTVLFWGGGGAPSIRLPVPIFLEIYSPGWRAHFAAALKSVYAVRRSIARRLVTQAVHQING